MLPLILLILALICFIIGASGKDFGSGVNFVSLGLAFWVLTVLIGQRGGT